MPLAILPDIHLTDFLGNGGEAERRTTLSNCCCGHRRSSDGDDGNDDGDVEGPGMCWDGGVALAG